MVQWINILHSMPHVFSGNTFRYNSQNYWKSVAFIGLLECFFLSLIYLVIKFVCRKIESGTEDDDINPLLNTSNNTSSSSASAAATKARIIELQQQLNSYPSTMGIVAICLLTATSFACQGLDNLRAHTQALLSLSRDMVDTAQANGGSGKNLDTVNNVLKHFQVYIPVMLLAFLPPLALCLIASISGSISFFVPYRLSVVRASVTSSFLAFIWLSFVHGAELSALVCVADFCKAVRSGSLTFSSSSSSNRTVEQEVLSTMLDSYVCAGAANNLVDTWLLELGCLFALGMLCVLAKGVYVDGVRSATSQQMWDYGSASQAVAENPATGYQDE